MKNNSLKPEIDNTKEMAIASIVVGVIAILLSCISPLMGILTAIIGAIPGIMAYRKTNSILSIVGIVVDCLGVAAAIYVWFFAYLVLNSPEV